jgi:spore germination cell wall hydrolase CwlJ-like protein
MNTHILEMILYGLIILIVGSLVAPAQTPSEIVTATIVLEAGGEYSEGAMHAVHEVIVNRSAKRQLTLAEVCLQPFQFSCWNGAEVASQIIKAKRHPRWREAFGYTGGADHYHADYCNPYWNKYMKVTAKIGRHIFYK